VKLVELDERLVAINDSADKAAALSPSDAKWRETTPEFASRAHFEGRKLTTAQLFTKVLLRLSQ
jgi:hypothetical protein